uniref:Rolling circle replication protein n=1 Tax=Streptomyces melanovinaceus TaxID=1182637 RepID=A0A0A6ZAT4_9ACTN|nr:rolling circle replication protein [Streptomyces melanovinaceus]
MRPGGAAHSTGASARTDVKSCPLAGAGHPRTPVPGRTCPTMLTTKCTPPVETVEDRGAEGAERFTRECGCLLAEVMQPVLDAFRGVRPGSWCKKRSVAAGYRISSPRPVCCRLGALAAHLAQEPPARPLPTVSPVGVVPWGAVPGRTASCFPLPQ